ncbi:hypothetical protein WMY93_026188 [Mugilogobius chulae]|uniref:Uncharacterized protein n=1 Tax=Mugilogobius chulae TaxID=88201 RepID=A0AAW0N3H4_9GOBI
MMEQEERRHVSAKSDSSMAHPIAFTKDQATLGFGENRMERKMKSCVSMKSNQSMGNPISFGDHQVQNTGMPNSEDPDGQYSDTQLNTVFKELEKNIFTFVKKELEIFNKIITTTEFTGERNNTEQESRDAFLSITLDFLRRMKHDVLADILQRKLYCDVGRCELKSLLQQRYQHLSEAIPKAGNATTSE